MKQKIIKETPIAAVEVKHILETIKEKRGELNFRAQKTLEHLRAVVSLDYKKAKEIEKKLLEKEISRMREPYVKKLLDTLPLTDKDCKTVLSGMNVTFTNDDAQTIVSIIKEHAR